MDEKKALPELSENGKKVMDIVKTMTILELAGLVENMQEEFGVSAAAPVMVPQGGTAGAAEPAEEKTTFDLHLTDAGANKIGVIKVVREATELGLKEAKDLVEAAPKLVKEGLAKDQAEELKKKFEEAGAKVELK